MSVVKVAVQRPVGSAACSRATETATATATLKAARRVVIGPPPRIVHETLRGPAEAGLYDDARGVRRQPAPRHVESGFSRTSERRVRLQPDLETTPYKKKRGRVCGPRPLGGFPARSTG